MNVPSLNQTPNIQMCQEWCYYLIYKILTSYLTHIIRKNDGVFEVYHLGVITIQ
jgi:hypothetical protein